MEPIILPEDEMIDLQFNLKHFKAFHQKIKRIDVLVTELKKIFAEVEKDPIIFEFDNLENITNG